MNDKLPDVQIEPDRWTLIRDIGLLQIKLIVDGLRDLILVPASLIAGIISIFSPGKEHGSAFYRLVCMGKQTEQWINLFGAYENAPQSLKEEYALQERGIDDLVNKVETYVIDEYKKGGVTRQAKDHLDRALSELQRNLKRGPDNPD